MSKEHAPQRGPRKHPASSAGSEKQKWLRPPAAGEYLGGISTSTLAKWRLAGIGPVYSKAGKNVIYGDGDLSAYAESRRRLSTSDPSAEAA